MRRSTEIAEKAEARERAAVAETHIAAQSLDRRRVWDLPVRICHWLLVLAFIGAYVTHRLGVMYFEYHVWCGYTVLVLVVFRCLWGVVGTYHARFGNFVRSPMHTLRYLRAVLPSPGSRRRGRVEGIDSTALRFYPGHNPLGAWMVVALLATLLVQALTGLFGNDEIINFGPFAGLVSDTTSVWLTSFHRQLFWWIAAGVAVHVAAVILHILRGENLVLPMLTGLKPAHHVPASQVITSSRLWIAAALLSSLTAALIVLVSSAPPSDAAITFE